MVYIIFPLLILYNIMFVRFSRTLFAFRCNAIIFIALQYNNSAVDIPVHVTLGTRTRFPEGLYSGGEWLPHRMCCFLTQMPTYAYICLICSANIRIIVLTSANLL